MKTYLNNRYIIYKYIIIITYKYNNRNIIYKYIIIIKKIIIINNNNDKKIFKYI